MASRSREKRLSRLMNDHRKIIADPVGTYFARGMEHKRVLDPRTLEPGYADFAKALEMHLAFKVLFVMLGACAVALAVHYFRVVTRAGDSAQSSVFQELGDGPVLLACVAGLLGIALMFANYGKPESVFYAMHVPLVLIVGLTCVWAWMTKDSPGDALLWTPVESGRVSVVWGVVMGLVAVFAVTEYVNGHMRLDGMRLSSGGAVAILGAAAVLAGICARVCELFVLTLRHNGFTEDSGAFAGAYLAGVCALLFAVVAGTRLVDASLTLFSGHFQTAFAPPMGLGAALSTSQTFRALRHAIYAVVGVTAALTWRREQLMTTEAPVSGEYLQSEWMGMAVGLVALPAIALVFEFGKELRAYSPGAYALARGALAAFVLMVVAGGLVPWTDLALLVAGALLAAAALEFVVHPRHRGVVRVSLVLGALFSCLRAAHRQWVGPAEEDSTEARLKWIALSAPLALGLEALVHTQQGANPSTSTSPSVLAAVQVFTRMLTAYTVLTLFTPDLRYDMVPGNGAASAALETVMVAGLLMTLGGGVGALVAGGEPGGEPDEEPGGGGVAGALSTWVLGAAAAAAFIHVRQEPVVGSYFGELQADAAENYKKVYRDIWAR